MQIVYILEAKILIERMIRARVSVLFIYGETLNVAFVLPWHTQVRIMVFYHSQGAPRGAYNGVFKSIRMRQENSLDQLNLFPNR